MCIVVATAEIEVAGETGVEVVELVTIVAVYVGAAEPAVVAVNADLKVAVVMKAVAVVMEVVAAVLEGVAVEIEVVVVVKEVAVAKEVAAAAVMEVVAAVVMEAVAAVVMAVAAAAAGMKIVDAVTEIVEAVL